MELDNTLKGVLIGGLITLAITLLGILGNFITHRLNANKEEQQWKRQQEAEREKLKREDEIAKEVKLEARKEQISTLYQNCIHYLSLLTAEDAEDTPTLAGDKRALAIEEAQKWLALLALRVGDKLDFDNDLGRFTAHPNRYAGSLRQTVIELAAQDEELPLHAIQKQKTPVLQPDRPKEGETQFQMSVDKAFRKEQLVEGIELPSSYSFTLNIKDMTNEQRQVLADIYFDSNQRIPSLVRLVLPVINPHANPQSPNHIYLSGNKYWSARFDPKAVESKEILERWRVEYVQELDRLKQVAEAAKLPAPNEPPQP